MTGWPQAAIRAAVCFLIVLAVGAALAFLQFLVSSQELPLSSVPAVATVIALLFHRVPLEVEMGLGFSVTFSVGVLLGTALVGWLLFRAGKQIAERLSGEPRVRLAHAGKVTLAYAVLAFLASFLGRLPGDLGFLSEAEGAGSLGPEASVHPTYGLAFVWPLLLACLFAGAGALWTVRDQLFASERGRWLRGALAGGWRMAWVAALLGAAGFLVVAAVHPDATRAYLDAVTQRGPAGVALAVLGTVMLLPNVGVGAAAAAMGGSIDLQLLGDSCALVSYMRFPEGLGPGVEPLNDACAAVVAALDTAPAGYFLFLVVPLAATVLGGWLAARRATGLTPREGAMFGAASAPVFGLAFLGFMFMAWLGYQVSRMGAPPGLTEAGVGPNLISGTLLAVLWGVVGGAGGGWLAGRRSRTPTSPG